jgi:excisionase family DNA binding protein
MNPSNTTPDALLTIKQVAAILVCSEKNVYALIEGGQLPYVPIGKSKGYRIDRKDLSTFITSRKMQNEGRKLKAPRPRLKHIKV